MIRRIIATSLRFRYLVFIISAGIMVFGLLQFGEMPVDVLPEFSQPFVEVQTEALGLSSEEVEALITVPLEADLLNGVAWLDQIYSESVNGLSSIILLFDPGTDLMRARQMVQERLTQTFALPNVSKPPTMLQPLSTTSRVMMVGLTSDKLSLIEMGVLARWNIKPRLMGVPGVANVAIWGHRERQLQVQVDPKLLRTQGVTLKQIIETTGDALWVSPLSYLESSTPGTAGWIDTPNQRLSIRHEMPISTPEDLAKVAVVGSRGLLLSDVAEVVEEHQPLIGDASLGEGPGLLLVIEKLPDANTLKVTRGVEEALEAMRPGLSGINIDTTIFRSTNYIEAAIGNLSKAMLMSVVLVTLILGVFLGKWRTALIIFVAITLSLVAAGIVLYFTGTTLNVMVLAGLVIALGVIVDDVFINSENIARQMQSSIGFATVIILLAIVPVFFLSGLSGAFFRPLAFTYVVAVLASMVVTLTVTPALSLFLLSNKPHGRRKSSPLILSLARVYNRILERSVHTGYFTFIIAGVIVFLGFISLPLLRLSLLPSFKQTDLLIQWEEAPGTSRAEMNRITSQVSRELKSIGGVRNVGAHVGRAITGDQVVGINSGELWVSLDPTANYDTVLTAIHEVIDGYPGLSRDVGTNLKESVNEELTGGKEDIVVRIYGHEFDILNAKAHEVRQILEEIDGVDDSQVDLEQEEPQVEIKVDLAAAQRYQVKPGDVRREATTLLSGLGVGNLYEQQKVFDVVVWGTPEIRGSLTDIGKLMIDTPTGQVSLDELATVRIVPAPVIIKHDVVSRFVDVGVNVGGRSLGSVAGDIKTALKEIDFPYEYHAEVLGASVKEQVAQKQILGVVLATSLGIYLLLQATFGSWRLAFITLFTLPIALAGGILATVASGVIISHGALFGFFTVLGVALRNTILLISHYQHLQMYEGVSAGSELVIRGAQERVAPILLTALTTGLVILPLVFFGDLAGFEIVYPMAIVILGGIVTSIILNLLIIPVLYLHFGTNNSLKPNSELENE